MKKLTFGTPEEFVPTKFCENLQYKETDISYNTADISFRETPRGCLLEFPLLSDEEVFGFGLQLKGFRHKNHKLMLRVNSDPVANTGDSHAPVPFFVTNKGYGMYIDTARYAEVHCGYGKNTSRKLKSNNTVIATAEDLYKKTGLKETTVMSVEIPVAKGVDVYIFEGENITDIVAQYNMFSGGGCTSPDWGLGVMYRCYAKLTDREIMETADKLRDRDIPCDIIGIEPGWQTNTYSCSYMWDDERFPEYKKMIKYLRDKDFHINLWEHAFVSSCSPIYENLHNYCGDYEVWNGIIPDFGTEKAMDIFASHHRDYLVADGIDGFKLDECDNSDFVHDWSFPNCTQFPSGMDGEVYHTLFGTLYMQTILKALGDTPTFSEVRNAGALCASYPFVLYSDLYDHKDFIRGIVNSGFSGILWTAEVRGSASKEDLLRRLETTVYSVQCVINAWAYGGSFPWDKFDCEDEVREILGERKKLLPILKAAMEKYKKTGVAPVRALVSDYTYDENTYGIDDQYMLGDSLMVAPLTKEDNGRRKVYIPDGIWQDYRTGEAIECGWHHVEAKRIPVYKKL